MLDFDLASIYGIETKRLKEQVRRNIGRFPDDFTLTREEYNFLRSQFATLEKGRGKHPKYQPFAFTEQGVAMLSSFEEVFTDYNDINEDKRLQLELSNETLAKLEVKHALV